MLMGIYILAASTGLDFNFLDECFPNNMESRSSIVPIPYIAAIIRGFNRDRASRNYSAGEVLSNRSYLK